MLQERSRARLEHPRLSETRSEQPEADPPKRKDLEAATDQQTAQFPVVQIELPVAIVAAVRHETADALPHRPRIPVIVENENTAFGQNVVHRPDGVLPKLVLRVPEEPKRGHQLNRLDAGGV